MAAAEHDFDLDGYLRRIGWAGDAVADAVTLRSLHRAHVQSIPFENVDVFLLRTVPSLALSAVADKMVRGRRGGACYEHNILLAAALRAIGFRVTYLTGRVLARAVTRLPRTHLLLRVDVPGAPVPYIADVGFGSTTALLEAIPLVDGAESVQSGRRFRLRRRPRPEASDLWALQAVRGAAWDDQYEFTLEPFEEIDIFPMNWHVATNPRSPARQNLYVGIARPRGHLIVIGMRLIEVTPDGARRVRALRDQRELGRVLADDFAIDVPAGARWPA
ncbi:arylamine N-acetyltransferase family protein [Actinoplanes teichomyceticus]|uniref:N-hydroxyarylamine O-acetyltransferase n=1 Tax=Actinoplanes teichomyceticus TaxID=1867 RepID=A0A561WK56_ACTTI|nr:arylamine N-acetyltransferase [Actinoplanes teichomyceticus]TWG24210.1 N-hydroxyarylamine O-acetyltransferase [Actinoplanes teichomyceticus]GIF12943.1 arylamine N-acetyltransferase [Actinoplanes teichomyceticus]